MDSNSKIYTKNKEKKIFVAYEFGLIIKALQALLEVIAGVLFYIVSTNSITTLMLAIARGELSEMSNVFLSDFLIKSAGQLSVSGNLFIVFYLLSHGVVKLIIIYGLFKKKRWAYPVAIIGLSGLILYQIYNLILSHSLFLLVFTVMDILILWLVWHERIVQERTELRV